ncbi:uncharacterized protein LOC135962400 [Calliphora vicina]|uniref:uncharacterized protein LOC135962400 n=1 Tax=Calliphora vicina TaxID=7373 RepID=UPI00325AAC58
MKLLVKLFIYLTIIVIITVLSQADLTQAKAINGMADLMGMDEPPEKVPEFESSIPRMRRDVDPQAADDGDIPKEEPKADARFRTRRETPPGESDKPKEFQEEPKMHRAKRQMPSPPGEMPMPPM